VPKNTSTKVPKGAEIIRTYERLEFFVKAFAKHYINLLIVVGPPGTAKSTHARTIAGTNSAMIQGGATPYSLYLHIHEAIDRPIILDDADKVFREKRSVFLLKMLCQTDKVKIVEWNSRTPEIVAGEVPDRFATTSPVCIIANSWPQDNPDIAAVESRGQMVYFAPDAKEMHDYAGEWFKDREVYEFIGDNLEMIDEPDLRLYWKAAERKRMKDDWKQYIKSQCMTGEKLLAYQLKKERHWTSDNQRAKEFSRITGKSERAFYRYLERLARSSLLEVKK
jgi:hypothetical protein